MTPLDINKLSTTLEKPRKKSRAGIRFGIAL
jgi:hypothetical protein